MVAMEEHRDHEHEHDHNKEPIILTSPGRLGRGILIVGITLAVSAGILITFFDDMIANPPPVSRLQQPSTPSEEEEPPAAAGTTTLAMLSGASVQGSPDYSPDPAEVPLGNKIVWKNEDTAIHTATSGTGPEDPDNKKFFDTSLVNPGESSTPVELTGVKEGDSINYYCFVHPFMNGKITITAAAEAGGQGGGSSSAGGAPSGPTIDILVGSANQGAPDFKPDSLTVKKGDKVTVVNQDSNMHTVTNGESATDPNSAKLFDTKFLESKKTATIDTASIDPGSYNYYCQVHPYMKGTLVVE